MKEKFSNLIAKGVMRWIIAFILLNIYPNSEILAALAYFLLVTGCENFFDAISHKL